MALIERNREPTPYELMVFGLLLTPFFGLIGALVLWRTGSWTVAPAFWVTGLLMAVAFLCVPSVRRPTYMAWMALLYPIGWVISHLLLALVYYGWVTPVGLLMRMFGCDPMRRRPDPEATTHWIRRKPINNISRYFRQY